MKVSVGTRLFVTSTGRRMLASDSDRRTEYTLRCEGELQHGCAVVVTAVGPGLSVTAAHSVTECGSCGTRLRWEAEDHAAQRRKALGISIVAMRDVESSLRTQRSDDELRAIGRADERAARAREALQSHLQYVTYPMPLPGMAQVHMTPDGLMVGTPERRSYEYASPDEMGVRSESHTVWHGDRSATAEESALYTARAERIDAERARLEAEATRLSAAYRAMIDEPAGITAGEARANLHAAGYRFVDDRWQLAAAP